MVDETARLFILQLTLDELFKTICTLFPLLSLPINLIEIGRH